MGRMIVFLSRIKKPTARQGRWVSGYLLRLFRCIRADVNFYTAVLRTAFGSIVAGNRV